MTVFVSYARRDNDMAVLQDIEDLLSKQSERLQTMLTARARPCFDDLFSPLANPYIDDLHHHRYGTDRHEAVEAALTSATSLLAVESMMYRQTPWTAKEFDYASKKGIPIFILSYNRTVIDLHSPAEKIKSVDTYTTMRLPELV